MRPLSEAELFTGYGLPYPGSARELYGLVDLVERPAATQTPSQTDAGREEVVDGVGVNAWRRHRGRRVGWRREAVR